ncbi:MAG: 50S ribosomal protein L20 [Bdellovibrionales bacterium]|nr:50S ribosomal protein L20 [Bdellovibrionales bacterium]
MRVKRGSKARKRRNRVLKLAKGFRGRSKNTIRQASARVDKALTYAYRDRRVKKREFRRLWITRINAAARQNGMSYSQLMAGLRVAGIELDRKALADIGMNEPESFAVIASQAASALQASQQ